MLIIKQLSILIISFSFIFLLTGCGTHKPNRNNAPPIKSLPTDLTKLLQDKSGIDFAHVAVHLRSNKTVVFSRLETDENGNRLYETSKIRSRSIPVSRLEGQSTYSKTSVVDEFKVDGQQYQDCSYINVNSEAKLICRGVEQYEYQPTDTKNDIPDQVVRKIEQVTGEEVSWIVLMDRNDSKILKKSNYKFINTTKMFDSKITLDLLPQLNVKNIFYRGSPCCCIIDDGDIKYRTCKAICL
ncbi:MAG TPA: hypothetical protein PKJ85_12610 [Nitrosomonas nitrosa]|nr:hypothetical protein [Nitrosomonas nitrosa]